MFRHACVLEHAVVIKERCGTDVPEGLEDWTVNHGGPGEKDKILEGRI